MSGRICRFSIALLVLGFVFASPSLVFAGDPKVQVFDGGMDRIFDATVKAVEANWKKVRSSDRAAGVIKFHTGVSLTTWGEDCTAVLRDLGNGRTEVSLKSKNSAQLYAWGVGTRIAKKLFKSIQAELAAPSSGSQPAPSAPPAKE